MLKIISDGKISPFLSFIIFFFYSVIAFTSKGGGGTPGSYNSSRGMKGKKV